MPADAEYNDYPISIIMDSMQKRADEGALTYFKWTCGGCGERVTANDPNTVLTKAKHEEKGDGTPCGYITDTTITGGNFMFILRAGRMLTSYDDLFKKDN